MIKNFELQKYYKACFDVRCSTTFWKRMNELEGPHLPEILSTHPASDKRALDLEKLMPQVDGMLNFWINTNQ